MATHSSASNGPSAPARNGPPAWRGLVGDLVCRVAIPLWLITGAAFKLAERNPNMLPQPVLKQVYALHDLLGLGSMEQFLEASMRAIIGIEFVLAAGMILLPRLSRWICLAVLGLFIAILGTLVAQGAANCGCFGASGPPPKVVLGVDMALFVLAAIFGPSKRPGTVLGFLVISVVGLALAFGIPSKAIVFEDSAHAPSTRPGDDPGAETLDPSAPTEATRSSSDPTPPETPAPSGDTPTAHPSTAASGVAAPPAARAAAPATTREWPPVPARPKGFYAPRFGTWVGQPLVAQEMMHMLRRPLPAGLDEGKWHIVLYRSDCDHCAELIDNFFAGPLETRTLLVRVPDASSGRTIPNRATDVIRTELLRVGNGPDYVIGTPVVITVVDGVVKAVCEKPVEDPDALMATLEAQ